MKFRIYALTALLCCMILTGCVEAGASTPPEPVQLPEGPANTTAYSLSDIPAHIKILFISTICDISGKITQLFPISNRVTPHRYPYQTCQTRLTRLTSSTNL